MGMCKIIKEEGLGLDVVSGGELFVALKGGIEAKNIIFHGNNKTKGELKFCIAVALGIFNLNANFYYDLDYEFCLAVDPQQELQNFISNNSYQKNDTLGIYMLEMVYKE